MSSARQLRKHQRSIAKVVFVISLIVLIVLGSTILFVSFLANTPRNETQARGWQRTSEIRVIMDSTADWARMMFNDLFGSSDNGVRIVEIHSHGWLLGNDSDDRIDAGRLTFIDIIYNSTVVKTGDMVGFFKGNNDFGHTRMYVDVVLEVNTNMRQVYVFIMLAGAGTTTFQLLNKQSSVLIWQDTETGNSLTQYTRRWIPSEAFFARQQIEAVLVVFLVVGTIITIFVLNTLPLLRKAKTPAVEDSEGL
jgi:hypothetical protein